MRESPEKEKTPTLIHKPRQAPRAKFSFLAAGA
jgi:hypothetical protein